MKKRIFAVLFAMLLLAGCGGAEEKNADLTEQEEKMLTELVKLPEDLSTTDAAAQGFYTIAGGAVVDGQESWDAFMAACEAEETASVMICQGTQKDGVVLDNVYYEAGIYTVVTDTTRDGYDDEKSVLKAPETYTDIKVFENFSLQEGGKEYTVCVLSNNADLTVDDFRTHWVNMTTEENHIYMLYVI